MKNLIKKALILLLSLCMLLSMAACGSKEEGNQDGNNGASESKEVDESRDTLTFCVNVAEPGSYNTWVTGATPGARAPMYAIMEPLIRFRNGEWQYILATSYEKEGDLSFLVHLRDNVLFHNGEKMNAEDVVYSLNLSRFGTGNAATFSCIDDFEVVDDLTVRVKLKYESSLLNSCLSTNITSKKYYEEEGEQGFSLHPVGTGYYMWDTYNAGDSLTLKAFDQYWGEHGTIKTLNFRFISETSQALIELEQGNIDVINANGSTLQVLNGNEKFRIESIDDMICEYVGFNMNSEKVQDIRVRQAVAHAVDREAINEGAREGLCKPIDNFITEALGAIYNPEASNYYEYDLDKAKALMAEMGYSESNKLHLKLMTDTQVARGLEAQQIKNMLDQVYFDIEIQTFEAAAFNDILKGGDAEWYDMLIRGMGVNGENPFHQALTLLSIDGTETQTCPMHITADSHPKAQEFTDKINAYMTSMDPEEQIKLAHEIQILDREICEEIWLFDRWEYYAVPAELIIASDGSSVMTLNTVDAYWVK